MTGLTREEQTVKVRGVYLAILLLLRVDIHPKVERTAVLHLVKLLQVFHFFLNIVLFGRWLLRELELMTRSESCRLSRLK